MLRTIEMDETLKNHNGHLTSGRLLARNTVWNLIGSGAPMVVAVFCIPILVRGLGKEGFGVLTLAWALILIGRTNRSKHGEGGPGIKARTALST